jgi:hypothetical protein
MYSRAASVAVVASLFVTAPATAGSRSYVFTQIDVPGGTTTQAFGINGAGQIVGFYGTNSGGQLGFVKARRQYSAINPPFSDMQNEAATGINDSREIVGYYQDNSSIHGFLYSRLGNFFRIDASFSGTSNSFAYGINDAGKIVGIYQNPDSGDHGL